MIVQPAQGPSWVINGSRPVRLTCPLYTQQQTHRRRPSHVHFVPTATSCTAAKARLIDHLVGGEQRRGTSRPSALAVLRFTTSSNLTGAWTGSSLGFEPLRMLSTYVTRQQRNFCSCSGTTLFGLRRGRTCSSLRAPGLGRFRKQSIFEPGGRSARMPAAFFRRLLEITMQPCRSRCDLRAHRGWRALSEKSPLDDRIGSSFVLGSRASDLTPRRETPADRASHLL
jgi:hypothetical protein